MNKNQTRNGTSIKFDLRALHSKQHCYPYPCDGDRHERWNRFHDKEGSASFAKKTQVVQQPHEVIVSDVEGSTFPGDSSVELLKEKRRTYTQIILEVLQKFKTTSRWPGITMWGDTQIAAVTNGKSTLLIWDNCGTHVSEFVKAASLAQSMKYEPLPPT